MSKMGRPRSVETPEELMGLFQDYKRDRGVDDQGKRNLLTITGFMVYLFDKGIIKSISSYWYKLPLEFSEIKQDIEELLKDNWQQATSKKDIDTTFGIFHGKNAHGYVDKIEAVNTNKNIQVDELSGITDEELKRIAGIEDE